MIAEDRLPNLRRIAVDSARFRLNHDLGKFTGLAWEHFSTGRAPDNERRWSAVSFDPQTYSVQQPSTSTPPFVVGLDLPAVVFDVPYFHLGLAPRVAGITSWGAHDPGTEAFSRPSGLRGEIRSRFGEYAAPDWIYGFSWPSAEKTRQAGAALRAAVRQRADTAKWLLAERSPDWQLAILVVSESHSAIEQFWHGVDPAHPLHYLPSAPHAREAILGVYEAIDELIGRLTKTFPDAVTVVFSMHGMGTNKSDLPAMLLVPELMYRHAFGRPFAQEGTWSSHLADGTPILGEGEVWEKAMRAIVPWPKSPGTTLARLRRLLGDKRALPGRENAGNLGWMPAARYSAFWSSMPAFALPAYYDVQVRLNVRGREASGLIPLADYDRTRKEIVAMISACRDPTTGLEVIENVVLPKKAPDEIGSTEADIYLSFVANTTGLQHPRLGTIGPMPYRRTGGHTGDWGFLYISGLTSEPGDRGDTEAFDVAPTIIDLMGGARRPDLSGTSLAPRIG